MWRVTLWRVVLAVPVISCWSRVSASAQYLPDAPLAALSLESADRADAPASGRPALAQVPARRDGVTLAFGGLVGGAAGLAAGGIIGGRALEDDCEDCGLVGLVYGSMIGEAIGVPLGVHLANRRQGSFGLALLASLATTGAITSVAAAADKTELLLAIPVLQIISSIAIERAAARAAGR